MKQPNLDQQILESIIRASLLEQQAAPKPVGGLFPDTPEQAKLRTQVRQDMAKNKPKVTNPAVTPTGGVPHWKTARAIYDSKGYVWDDEKGALTAIKAGIKNIKDYKAVTKELQKISGGRGIGAYLHSFMNAKQLFGVAEYLMKVLPENQWHWTIKNIVAWDDILAFIKYISPDRGGIIPKSERRRNANQLFSDLYSNWKQNPVQAKKDPLFKMVTHPMLYKDYAPYLKNEYEKWENHEDRFMASIVYSFIPYIGPYLSSAIMAADAQAYIDEGDSYTGGLYYTFAALPLAGGLVSKLISRVGLAAKGGKYWKQLGSKMAKAYKSGKLPVLTKSEQKLMELLRAADKNVIVSDLKAAMPKLKQSISAATEKTISQGKKIIDQLMAPGRSLAAKEAVLRTITDKTTRIAGTIAVYAGTPMLYDKLYVEMNAPTQEEINNQWAKVDADVINDLFKTMDATRSTMGESIITKNLQESLHILNEDSTGMLTDAEERDLPDDVKTDDLHILEIPSGTSILYIVGSGLLIYGLYRLFKKSKIRPLTWMAKTAFKGTGWLRNAKIMYDNGVIMPYKDYLRLTERIGKSWKTHNKDILYSKSVTDPTTGGNLFLTKIHERFTQLTNKGKTATQAIDEISSYNGQTQILTDIINHTTPAGKSFYIPGIFRNGLKGRNGFQTQVDYLRKKIFNYTQQYKNNPEFISGKLAAEKSELAILTRSQLLSKNWTTEAPGLWKWWNNEIKKIQKKAGTKETGTGFRKTSEPAISDDVVKQKTHEAVVEFMLRPENASINQAYRWKFATKLHPGPTPKPIDWKRGMPNMDTYYNQPNLAPLSLDQVKKLHKFYNTTAVSDLMDELYPSPAKLNTMKGAVIKKIGL